MRNIEPDNELNGKELDWAALDPQVRSIPHVPFLKLLNILPAKLLEGGAVFEMQVDDRHLRTHGIVHGGVMAALLDTAMGMAAASQAPPRHHVVTVQLNINFIRPAWEGETLRATGEIRHGGRQTAVARGEIRTAENVLVASGTATFMYLANLASPDQKLEKKGD